MTSCWKTPTVRTKKTWPNACLAKRDVRRWGNPRGLVLRPKRSECKFMSTPRNFRIQQRDSQISWCWSARAKISITFYIGKFASGAKEFNPDDRSILSELQTRIVWRAKVCQPRAGGVVAIFEHLDPLEALGSSIRFLYRVQCRHLPESLQITIVTDLPASDGRADAILSLSFGHILSTITSTQDVPVLTRNFESYVRCRVCKTWIVMFQYHRLGVSRHQTGTQIPITHGKWGVQRLGSTPNRCLFQRGPFGATQGTKCRKFLFTLLTVVWYEL